jgi:nucleoside-diphosphate-sugar epimerase
VAIVLITGGSGLIGRRALEAFAAVGSDEVISVGRADVDLLAPGAWTALLDQRRPDVVVHLAWSASALADYRHRDDNWRWAETTIEGAELAAGRGIRFLATGTSVDAVPADDAYSRSKAVVRGALADRVRAGELSWLRPFYVFDEERPSPAVLRAALAAKAAAQPVRLATPGARHDFVHSRDVGTAIRTVVTASLAGSIDLGAGAAATVAELVESYGCEWIPDGAPSAAATTEDVADVGVLRANGWSPEVTDRRFGRPV